jgi:hypothetical protein
MGACCGKQSSTARDDLQKTRLVSAIERSSVNKLKMLLESNLKNFNIDDTVIKLQGVISPQIEINSLAYSLRLGKTDIFKYLYEEKGASLKKLASIYSQAAKTPIEVICENGYLTMLEYYLPLYLDGKDTIDISDESEDEELSIFAPTRQTRSHTVDKDKFVGNSQTAIMKACERGHAQIVKYLVDYFNKKQAPKEFDVNYQEETHGENCPLIAVRNGNLEMIKYLHRECKGKFALLNKRNESAIQAAVVGSKRKPNLPFLEIIKYLVEVVGLSLMNEYEEALLVCEDKRIIDYIEYKCREAGINTGKRQIDEKYSLYKNSVPSRLPVKLEEKLNRVQGTDFNFNELFREELKESASEISSITLRQSATPISITPQISFID